MTRNLPACPGDLPESLVDVAEALGMSVALKLMQHYGGLEVKFPIVPKPGHPILKALGEDDGYALCALLSNTSIYIPHGKPRRSSRDQVLALEARGLDRAEIARQLGISQRHVRRVANAAVADPDQLTLFED